MRHEQKACVGMAVGKCAHQLQVFVIAYTACYEYLAVVAEIMYYVVVPRCTGDGFGIVKQRIAANGHIVDTEHEHVELRAFIQHIGVGVG